MEDHLVDLNSTKATYINVLLVSSSAIGRCWKRDQKCALFIFCDAIYWVVPHTTTWMFLRELPFL